MCFTILFQSVQRTWIVASWKMNQSYIASELCEKRFEEKSCCAGSCYLNKELEANEEQEQSAPVNEREKVEYVSDLFQSSADFLSLNYTVSSIDFTMLWSLGQTKSFTDSIFHPPSLIG